MRRAGAFYNSLRFGKSVSQALRQAKVYLGLAGGKRDVPQPFCADGNDPEVVVLVNPEAGRRRVAQLAYGGLPP